jgi:glycosyltransferase involved in cell wall biosynthesis
VLANKKITVVLPAYNAAQTLKQTFDEIPRDVVDDIILIDDASRDATVEMARRLGILTIRRSQPRLRSQSEDLLPGGSGARSRHRHHASPGLPIYAEASATDGVIAGVGFL